MGHQSFNFATVFLKLGFSAPNFAFWDENFPTRTKFSNSHKLGEGNCHCWTWPVCCCFCWSVSL